MNARIYTQSADFAIAHLRTRTLELSPKSINNNETYADMTSPKGCTKYKVQCTMYKGHKNVIPVGV